jgi:hypothetical protein
MSWRASRLSNPIEALIASMIASGPAAKRPPHIVLDPETGVTHLHPYNDPRMDLARGMAVLGLPVTVILDREGREIARLTGEADWNGPAARAVLEGLLADT